MIKRLVTLWFTFFYVGLFTIGGGYAMLPLLEKEVVEKHKWLTHEELIDVFALGQSTPGVIALNVSTYVGVGQYGLLGGLAATLGMITPSLVIITCIAYFINEINQIPLIMSIFAGIRAVVAGLLISTVYKLGKRSVKDFLGGIIVLAGFTLIVFVNISPVFVVVGSGILGVIIYGLWGFRCKKGNK